MTRFLCSQWFARRGYDLSTKAHLHSSRVDRFSFGQKVPERSVLIHRHRHFLQRVITTVRAELLHHVLGDSERAEIIANIGFKGQSDTKFSVPMV